MLAAARDRGRDRIVLRAAGDVQADRRQQVDALEEDADRRPRDDARGGRVYSVRA